MGDRLGGGTALAALLAAEGSIGRGPAQPLVDHLQMAPTKEWKKAPLSRKTISEIKILRRALRAGNYDAVLDLQGAIRSAVVGRMAGSRRLIGEAEPRERAARWLFTERVTTFGAHVIEQDLELASAMSGDDLKFTKPWLPVDPAAKAWADEILQPSGAQPGRLSSIPEPDGAPSAGRRSGMRGWPRRSPIETCAC